MVVSYPVGSCATIRRRGDGSRERARILDEGDELRDGIGDCFLDWSCAASVVVLELKSVPRLRLNDEERPRSL